VEYYYHRMQTFVINVELRLEPKMIILKKYDGSIAKLILSGKRIGGMEDGQQAF